LVALGVRNRQRRGRRLALADSLLH
jgi:hypothetical protein